jgi:hypothetical protein
MSDLVLPVFKKGHKEPIGSSEPSKFYPRSVLKLEVDLTAGEYVVHVKLQQLALFGFAQ